jgi:hypothetical protein
MQEENIQVEVRKFKMPLWAEMWLLLIGNFLGFAFLLPFVMKEMTVSARVMLVGISTIWVTTIIVDVLLGLCLVQYYKVKISPDGISCFNFWGIYSFVVWDEIRGVRVVNFLGLKYEKVFFSNARFPLWVPLFIKNRDGFTKALSEFAPTSNLLRQAFERG